MATTAPTSTVPASTAPAASTAPTSSDYGAPAARSSKLHRPLIAAAHALYLISSLIVMSIAAYFLSKFELNRQGKRHLKYWVTVGALSVLFFLPALLLPFLRRYKGYLAPLSLIFSYLWLAAVVKAVEVVNYGVCYPKCGLLKTLEAFAFLALFTSVLSTLLESRLWDVQRFKGHRAVDAEKGPVAPVGTTTTAPTSTV